MEKGLDIALPSWEFTDTEVSTNIVRRFSTEISRTFTYGVTFDGAESNSVEIAFGKDVDADLVLGAYVREETPVDWPSPKTYKGRCEGPLIRISFGHKNSASDVVEIIGALGKIV